MAATAICPGWPRRAWMSSCSGASEPMTASVERQAVTTEPRARRCASHRAARATAGRELRAVDESEPLLGAEDHGGEARPRERLGAGDALDRLTFPDHHGRHVG
jgi:hypothetical protein